MVLLDHSREYYALGDIVNNAHPAAAGPGEALDSASLVSF